MTDDISKHIFIINDIVEFDSQRNALTLLISPFDTITLNIPASRCLELLLIKHNKIVPQADFFYAAWEKYNTYVTLGTFYQNISLLRKSLKKIGLDDDIIVTIPRKGLSITEKTKVEEKFPPEHLSNLLDLFKVFRKIQVNGKTKIGAIVKNIILCSIFFIIILTPVFIININNKINMLEYSILSKSNLCIIYCLDIINKNNALTILDNFKLDYLSCNYTYLNVSPYLSGLSIGECDQVINITEQ